MLRYNLRKFDRLPVHLQRSNRYGELNCEILFNFEWIYHKSMAFNYDTVVEDYQLSADFDARLVETALRQSKPYVGASCQNLAVELVGRLLPYIGVYQTIRRLIADCDRRGLQLSAVVPLFPYRQPPGGPLQHSIEMTLQPGSTDAGSGGGAAKQRERRPPMQFLLTGELGQQLVLAKDPSRPEVHVIDPLTGKRKSDIVTSVGVLHVSASGRVAAVVDYDRERAVKIHRLDGFDEEELTSAKSLHSRTNGTKSGVRNGFISLPNPPAARSPSHCMFGGDASIDNDRGRFVGHLVPSRHIELSSRDRHRLTKICLVGDSHICLGIESTTDTRSWFVVGDVITCTVVHAAPLRGRVTCIRPWKPERKGVVYAGIESTLYTYQLMPEVKVVSSAKLPDIVRHIAFTKVNDNNHCNVLHKVLSSARR
jgi:hypothetical protein